MFCQEAIFSLHPDFIRRFTIQPYAVYNALFAPDGDTLLIAGSDGLVQRFDIDE